MVKLFSKSRKRNTFSARKPTLFKGAAPLRRGRSEEAWQPLKIDKRLAFIVFAFICFGLIFTYSSSAFDSTAYFKRQVLFDALGIAAALFLSQAYLPLQKIFKPIWLMYGTWALLVIVLFQKLAAVN